MIFGILLKKYIFDWKKIQWCFTPLKLSNEQFKI